MKRIGVAGAGGIGSNVAMLLVRMGATSFTLIDFDQVDRSNLNRQFYFARQQGKDKVDMLRTNLLQINPELDIAVSHLRLDKKNMGMALAGCRVVVEGFDDPQSKKQLLEILSEKRVPVVSASGISNHDLTSIGVRQVGNATIVGDFVSDCRQQLPYPPKIMIVAAMMADLVWRQLGEAGESYES